MADVEVLARRLSSLSAMLSVEEDWTMGDLGKNDAEERIRAKRRSRDLQKSCRAKRRSVPEGVPEAVTLAVKLVDDAVLRSSPGAGSVVDPHFDELTRKLTSPKAEVISMTAKLSDLEEARDNVAQEHEDLLKKIRIETKTSEHILAGRAVLLFDTMAYYDQLKESSKRLMSVILSIPIR